MWKGERQSWAEFKVEKTVISVPTVFLSRSILCAITQIMETLRAFWFSTGCRVHDVDEEKEERERQRRPGGKLGNFVALH